MFFKKKIKFFPWSPGIPWTISKGKYVEPKIPFAHLLRIIKTRKLLVTSYGGLLESYYGLFLMETFRQLNPQQEIAWAGDAKFDDIFLINGFKITETRPTSKDLKRFPTPIFFDKENGVYFNYLNNYKYVMSYYLESGYPDSRLVSKQIMEKTCISSDYWKFTQFNLPKISLNKKMLLSSSGVNLDRSYYLIFPEYEELNLHTETFCLNWTPRMVNALAAMLLLQGIQLVVCTSSVSRYFGGSAKVIPFDLTLSIYLIKHAAGVLSKDPDFLFIASHLSNGVLFCDKMSKPFDLRDNSKLILKENVIYEKQNLLPADVINYLKEK